MIPERRKFRRWFIDPGEIQVVVSTGREAYTVKDFSMGGLALKYNPEAGEPFESESVDIIAVDYDRFTLRRVPCKTVYDIPILMENSSLRGGYLRLRGLQFLGITEMRKEKLDYLLSS